MKRFRRISSAAAGALLIVIAAQWSACGDDDDENDGGGGGSPTATPTVDAGATPTPTELACIPGGQPCELNEECCSEICGFGTCSPIPP